MMWLRLKRLFLVTALLPGCAHGLGRSHPDTVEGLYDQGVDDLEGGLYPEAIKAFAELKTKYPYSRFAALSELRTADTHIKRSKYQEGIDTYRNFLKFHPSHEQADYALFKIGEAYFEQLPADWWFLPPSAEKDQSNTHMAIAAYNDMLARFTAGPNAHTARQHLAECRRRLADHEMYVARFYFKRHRWAGAVQRAELVLRDFASLGLDAEALLIVGEAQLARGEPVAGDAALQRLLQQFPDSPEATTAQGLLHRGAKSEDSAKTYPQPPPAT